MFIHLEKNKWLSTVLIKAEEFLTRAPTCMECQLKLSILISAKTIIISVLLKVVILAIVVNYEMNMP